MDFFTLKKSAMLMGSGIFWLPQGVARSDVIAAYRFKGVASESYARGDISGNNHTLTKGTQSYNGVDYTPSWSSTSGYTFAAVMGGNSGYLDNSALDTANIKCAIVCYTGMNQDNRGYLITAGGSSGLVQIFAATSAEEITAINDQTQEVVSDYVNYGGPGFVSSAWAQWSVVGQMAYSGSTPKQSGVIGVNFQSKKMYLDGVLADLAYTTAGSTYTDIGSGGHQGYTFGNSHTNKAELNGGIHAGKTIISAAFYSTELSADQHAQAAGMMLAL